MPFDAVRVCIVSDAVHVSLMGQLVGKILDGRGTYQMVTPKVRMALDGRRARRGDVARFELRLPVRGIRTIT